VKLQADVVQRGKKVKKFYEQLLVVLGLN